MINTLDIPITHSNRAILQDLGVDLSGINTYLDLLTYFIGLTIEIEIVLDPEQVNKYYSLISYGCGLPKIVCKGFTSYIEALDKSVQFVCKEYKSVIKHSLILN